MAKDNAIIPHDKFNVREYVLAICIAAFYKDFGEELKDITLTFQPTLAEYKLLAKPKLNSYLINIASMFHHPDRVSKPIIRTYLSQVKQADPDGVAAVMISDYLRGINYFGNAQHEFIVWLARILVASKLTLVYRASGVSYAFNPNVKFKQLFSPSIMVQVSIGDLEE